MTEIQRTPGNAKGRCRTVSAGEFVWTVATASGQGTTVAEQTQATLAQLEASLLEAGSSKERIVEAVVYLTDMNKKAEMDAVWCDWIPADGWSRRGSSSVRVTTPRFFLGCPEKNKASRRPA